VSLYYSDDSVTLWHGDCREILPLIVAGVLITDPPYPNNAGYFVESVPVARAVLALDRWREVIAFWTELESPPVPLPAVAVHIWHRTNVNGRPYEPAYHFAADGKKRRSDVIRHPAIFDGAGPGCHEYLGHPNQKPLSVMRQLVEKTSGTIVDPFAGSGSTLVAAKYAGRQSVGIELDERYCELIAKRLAQDVLPIGGVP
jgi:DNA modification methylase